ncbi:MAG: ferrous iron transport protein A [Planctomycetales bacterium]|nr:ferrous iron transport protein A [Planctomycetales bacterium]
MSALHISPQHSPVLPNMQPLALLRRGQAGVVRQVTVDPADSGRLKSMGICVGRTVQVTTVGNPLIVKVLGSRVGLAGALASCVTVEVG